jgi:hypothetical protein
MPLSTTPTAALGTITMGVGERRRIHSTSSDQPAKTSIPKVVATIAAAPASRE